MSDIAIGRNVHRHMVCIFPSYPLHMNVDPGMHISSSSVMKRYTALGIHRSRYTRQAQFAAWY